MHLRSLAWVHGGRAHGMRYDDPEGSPKGLRPEGISAVAMEIQTAEQIEEESIGGDSEVEVLEPLEGHIRSNFLVGSVRRLCFCERGVSAVQGHPRSLMLVPLESAYATSY